MKNILVHRNTDSLKLTFVDSFHPSELNIKADHWYFKYKLSFLDDSFVFDGWFTGRFWYLDGDNIIAFEEYNIQNFDKEIIKHDRDIELRIFLVDFRKRASTKFSRLREGNFHELKLTENGKIIYLKKQYDKTGEFEVNIDSLKFVQINN